MKNVILFLISSLLFFSCSGPKENPGNNANIKMDKEDVGNNSVLSRDKFEELFYGKPRGFVEKRLGQAEKIQELNGINATWLWYKHKTYLNDSSIPDEFVKIKFDDWIEGVVVTITYK